MPTRFRSPRLAAIVALPLAILTGARVAQRVPTRAAQPLAVVDSLAAPEALSFDAAHDVYLVSNVNGDPGVKDGNGFIARITADGKLDSLHFIQGGRDGVVLNAPMGSRVRGDTLWVLDVDALRAFDTRSGAPLRTIDLAPLGALFLNDLAFGPDGDIWITDTGVHNGEHTGPDRIYHVDRHGTPSVALESAALSLPDGLDWDPRARRFVIAPFGGTDVMTWQLGASAPAKVAPGKGRFDGVEVERDGSIIVTSWNDSSVSVLDSARLVRRLGPLTMTPADVSMDAKRHRVGIVSLEAGRFELWSWPER